MDRTSATEPLIVRRLGRVPYGEALRLQERLRRERMEGRLSDTVLLLEHPDVITFGRRSRPENALLGEQALRAAGYEVHHVQRGGDVTYHGPGQLVGYPILDLSRRGADLHRYLRALEGVLIDTLADFAIAARRRDGFAGVWIDESHKIASLGVAVRRWTTMHGFSLNVACDLRRFDVVIACGLQGVRMTDMRQVLGRAVDLGAVQDRVELHLHKAFP